MKKAKERCLMLALTFLWSFTVNANGSSHWDAFLKRPDEDAFVMLEKSIAARAQRCDWGKPINLDVAPAEMRTRLFELIAKGNESAFRAGLLVSRCLDGGDLEDFYRSAGTFFEVQPHAFLQRAKEKIFSDSQLRHMLTTLPLDTVDNIDRKISVVQNRIAILKAIGDSSFEEIRKRSLSVLEKEKDDLDKIKIEMGKAKDRNGQSEVKKPKTRTR